MNHLLKKIGYTFCKTNYTNFYAAETVLRNFFGKQLSNPNQSALPESYSLAKQIMIELELLKNNKEKIDPIVIDKIKDMFEPTKGIPIMKLEANFQDRQRQGVNKQRLFPLNPHSAVVSNIMKLIYEKSGIQHPLEKISKEGLIYLLGSKGLAKSTSLIMIKYFHNLRIPYIIENAQKDMENANMDYQIIKDSLFSDNYKLFYFQAKNDIQFITQQLYKQIKNDFPKMDLSDLIPKLKQLRKSSHQFRYWLQQYRSIYKAHNIQVKAIVDQANQLYWDPKKRQKNIQNFTDLSETFYQPMILVSSKNNSYLTKDQDPIISVAIGESAIKQRILDNSISPQQRIRYTIESLIFQMKKQKYNIQKIRQVLRNLKQIPMSTHLACRKYIQQIQKKINKQDKSQQKKNINDLDLQALLKNISEIQVFLKSADNKKREQAKDAVDIIFNLIAYAPLLKSSKSRIKIDLQNEKVDIQPIENKITQNSQDSRQLNSEQSQIITKNMEISNYQLQQKESKAYFTNHFFVHQNKENQFYLYCCLTKSQIQIIKDKISSIATAENIKIWQSVFNIVYFKFFLSNLKGNGFQNLINAVFVQSLKIKKSLVMFINFKNASKVVIFNKHPTPLKKFNNEDFKSEWLKNEEDTKKHNLDQQQNIKSFVQMISSKDDNNYCFRAKANNIAFDFLITQCSNSRSRVSLYFIDASTKTRQDQKIDKFSNMILKNNFAFKSILNYLANKKNIHIIQIFFFALSPAFYLQPISYSSKTSDNEAKKLVDEQVQSKIISTNVGSFRFGKQLTFKWVENDGNFSQSAVQHIQILLDNLRQIFVKGDQTSKQSIRQVDQLFDKDPKLQSYFNQQ